MAKNKRRYSKEEVLSAIFELESDIDCDNSSSTDEKSDLSDNELNTNTHLIKTKRTTRSAQRKTQLDTPQPSQLQTNTYVELKSFEPSQLQTGTPNPPQTNTYVELKSLQPLTLTSDNTPKSNSSPVNLESTSTDQFPSSPDVSSDTDPFQSSPESGINPLASSPSSTTSTYGTYSTTNSSPTFLTDNSTESSPTPTFCYDNTSPQNTDDDDDSDESLVDFDVETKSQTVTKKRAVMQIAEVPFAILMQWIRTYLISVEKDPNKPIYPVPDMDKNQKRNFRRTTEKFKVINGHLKHQHIYVDEKNNVKRGKLFHLFTVNQYISISRQY